MPDSAHYVIRGGIEGRERLRVLRRVMQASTSALLDRIGFGDGIRVSTSAAAVVTSHCRSHGASPRAAASLVVQAWGKR